MIIKIVLQDSPEFGLSLSNDKYKIKWTKCNNLPVAMRSAGITLINDVMFIGGGVCPDHNDEYYIFMYNLKENKWTRLPTPLPQRYGAVVNINNKLTVIGGRDSINGRAINKVLTLQDHKWTSLYGNMNSARTSPLVVSHHQYIIVGGGESVDNAVVDSIEVFDGKQWTISKTCLPQPMYYINATICNNSLVIAGFDDADGDSFNGVYITTVDNIIIDYSTTSKSTDNNKWSELAYTPYWSTTIIPNTTPPVVVGGHDEQDNTTDDIMAYDDSTNSWRTISHLPIKCCYTSIVKLSQSIIIAGGVTDGGTKKISNDTIFPSVMIGELVKCT